jgi:hypothetical protein
MTKEQAMACHYRQELHYITASGREVRVRVNGKCKTWKTRPAEFRLPVKYGLYEAGAVDQTSCGRFHLAEECPLS